MPKDKNKSRISKNSGARGKNLEKRVTKALNDAGIKAHRIERLTNYGISLPDVVVDNHEYIKIDCKSRTTSAHATLFETDVINKYIKDLKDRAVMPFALKGMRGFYVTIQDDFFLDLLKAYLEKVEMTKLLGEALAKYPGLLDTDNQQEILARLRKRPCPDIHQPKDPYFKWPENEST